MPLADGTLTDDEFTNATVKLFKLWEKNGGVPACPSCGSKGFFIHPSLLGNRSDTLSPLAPHTRFPTLVKYCKECGHVTEYAARILGIDVLTVEGS